MKFKIVFIAVLASFFLQYCKIRHTLVSEAKRDIVIEPEDTTSDGFLKSFFVVHGGTITTLKLMQYRFTSFSKDEKEFIYRYIQPGNLVQSDTLIFRMDFKRFDNSYLIKKDFYIAYQKYNSIADSAEKKIKLRIDTFHLKFEDSIHVGYEGKIYPIYKFDCLIGDFQCNTFFVNDSMGVFKRYGLHYSDCVEQEYMKTNAKYNLQVHLINELGKRKDFHNSCTNQKIWIGGNKWPHSPD